MDTNGNWNSRRKRLWTAALGLVLAAVASAAYSLTRDSPARPIADDVAEQLVQVERVAVGGRIAALRQARQNKEVVARVGEWRSRRFNAEARAWQVQLERDRDSGHISGQIRVNGSYALADAAKVDGQMKGNAVSGTVIDPTGRQLATFTGNVDADGMSGTYRTADGDEGEWSDGDQRRRVVARAQSSQR